MDELSVLTWRIPHASTAAVEAATVPEAERIATLLKIRDAIGAPEMVYLPTCQRVALVLLRAPDDAAERALAAYRALGRELPAPQVFRGRAAFHHMAETAASLDSLVVGEPQILGQVKAAANLSDESGLSGPGLRHVFNLILRSAKAVRTDTELFRGKVSLVPLTEELVESHLSGIAAPQVAVFGTGQIGERMIDVLRRHPHARLHVVSRRRERAAVVAAAHNATPHALDELLHEPPVTFDLIALAMGTDEPILRGEAIHRLVGDKPALLLDLAVPRNVDPTARPANVRLFQMDDLSRMSEEAKGARRSEIEHARAILDDQLDRVEAAYAERKLAHDLEALSQRFQEVAEARLQRAIDDGLDLSDPRARKWYEQTVRALLHEAAAAVKKAGCEAKR